MNVEALYSVYLRHPSVQTDTRKLAPGDLFFALRGPNFNGNEFAPAALERGAAFVVIDDPAFATDDRTILVPDALVALQDLARHHRRQLTIPVLAITGSNGKTTTKELIHAVLSTTYKTTTTEGNLNNHIGVPLTLLRIKPDQEMAVIEMGANHLGEIASYCTYTEPTHGLITNCGKAHLEGFGSEEGVRKGKGELFDYLRNNGGSAFVMWDYDYLQTMSGGINTTYTYGTKTGNIRGVPVPSEPFLEVAFEKGFAGTVATKLVGAYNLPNVLAAVAVGKAFSVTDANITAALQDYVPSNSRSELVRKGTNTIILDAYNANPSSMKLAIENFARSKETAKILLLGAMAELGAGSIKEHQEIVKEISKYSWKDVCLVGGDFLKFDHTFRSMHTAEEAGEWLKKMGVTDSFLLVKGSRSTGMEKVLQYL
jgi:UDP-N-acetylmuramoyl-tripeptide--D-alanyl-D-alanine ligase